MVRTMRSRAMFQLSYRTIIIPLWLCCLVQIGGCRTSPPSAGVQKDNALKERIDALQNEPLGPIDSGNAIAYPTENTEYIIAHKDEAVPLLVEALREDKKPVLIGFAAYCLRRIGSNQGKDRAATLYKPLADRGDQLSLKERFARSELKKYLDQTH
jgi:hypothetical protein